MENPDPLIAGAWDKITKGSRATLLKRALVAADWAVRVFAPMDLEARGRIDRGRFLRYLPQIVNRELAQQARDYCLVGISKLTAAADSAQAVYVAAHAATTGDSVSVVPYATGAIWSAVAAGRAAITHNVGESAIQAEIDKMVTAMLEV